MENTNEQKIPTAIVNDFNCFLDIIKEKDAPLTASQKLGRKAAFAINQKMTSPQKGVTDRSDTKYYPLLMLFSQVALESGLTQMTYQKGKYFYTSNNDKIERFQAMQPLSQYFFLLEVYLLHCDVESIEPTRCFRYTPSVWEGIRFLAKDKQGTKHFMSVSKDGPLRNFSIMLGYWGLIFEHFGLWKLEREENPKGYSKTFYRFTSLIVTDLGQLIFSGMLKNSLIPPKDDEESIKKFSELLDEMDADEQAWVVSKGKLYENYKSSFPNGSFSDMIEIKPEKKYKKGTYTFKISLNHQKKIWRKIQLSDSDTLEDLHDVIQQAFSFDNDHLFSFYLHPTSRTRFAYSGPGTYSEIAPFADEAIIGELNLTKGQSFRYLFDFGASWWFDIKIENIEEDKTIKKALLIETQGDAPEQYPSWD